MSNDTPRTDAIGLTANSDQFPRRMTELAREMERELATLRERLAEAERLNNEARPLIEEAHRECVANRELAEKAEQRAERAEALADERIRAAVAAERERCAKACEATHLRRSAMGMKDGYNAIMQCADAIRAAGK